MDKYETLVVRTGTQRYSTAAASTNQSISSKVEEQHRSARSETDMSGRCTWQGRHQPSRARWQLRSPLSTASVGRKVRGPGGGRLGARAAQRGDYIAASRGRVEKLRSVVEAQPSGTVHIRPSPPGASSGGPAGGSAATPKSRSSGTVARATKRHCGTTRGGSRETRTRGLGLALRLADDKCSATSRTFQAQDDIQVTATTKAAD
jgi:hypothetical protein